MIGLFVGWAWAQAPVAEVTAYAGLPLTEVAAAGFEPVLKRAADELWIALPQGGSARVFVTADLAAADAVFDGLARTSVTHWPPTAEGLPGERAQGDGRAILLVRDRNAVVWVRTPLTGDAKTVATRLLSGLTIDPAACAGGTAPWNACGAFDGTQP